MGAREQGPLWMALQSRRQGAPPFSQQRGDKRPSNYGRRCFHSAQRSRTRGQRGGAPALTAGEDAAVARAASRGRHPGGPAAAHLQAQGACLASHVSLR